MRTIDIRGGLNRWVEPLETSRETSLNARYNVCPLLKSLNPDTHDLRVEEEGLLFAAKSDARTHAYLLRKNGRGEKRHLMQ